METIIKKLESGNDLSEKEMGQAFEQILDPDIGEEDIAGFLTALAKRNINAELLTAAARVLIEHATQVHLSVEHALDTAGTGGDQSGSFNFSTAAGMLAAACGVPVAKHGNRSISSKSGSADLLEALNVPIDLGPEEVAVSVKENNFGFMMAPRYHPATKKVQQVRKKLGLVTVFNFLGPLVNPARVPRQVVGVYDNDLRSVMAEALRRLGTEKSWVVWGEGGLDELTLSGKTFISEVTQSGVVERVLEPEDAVLRKCDAKYLKGGDGQHNAKLLVGIFDKSFFGPIVNGVLINCGAALCVAGKAENILEGVRLAKKALDNGDAIALLERLQKNH